ncbi:MAG: hypothetical protein IPI29_10030 [Ignavibacteria bacterium]|nr:hypothetical protein [Ignavibacteria bacterium]
MMKETVNAGSGERTLTMVAGALRAVTRTMAVPVEPDGSVVKRTTSETR